MALIFSIVRQSRRAQHYITCSFHGTDTLPSRDHVINLILDSLTVIHNHNTYTVLFVYTSIVHVYILYEPSINFRSFLQNIPKAFSSVKSLMYNDCTTLSMRLLEVLGHALKLKVCEMN